MKYVQVEVFDLILVSDLSQVDHIIIFIYYNIIY